MPSPILNGPIPCKVVAYALRPPLARLAPMLSLSNRRLAKQVIVVAVLVAAPLAITAPVLKPDAFGALATAIQSVTVAVALLLALLTYRSDSRDRRVDRVLSLHQEFFDPDFQVQRRALVDKVRSGPQPHAELAGSGLSEQEYLARIKVLRYFERVQAARVSDSLEDRLAASLLGSHAAYWDLALELDDKASRRPLHDFASWANDFAENSVGDALFTGWGATRSREFGKVRRGE